MAKTQRRGMSEEEFERHVDSSGGGNVIDISENERTVVWLGPWSAVYYFVGKAFLPVTDDEKDSGIRWVIYTCDEDPYNLIACNRSDFEPEDDRFLKWHQALQNSDLDDDIVIYSAGAGRDARDTMVQDMRPGDDGNFRYSLRPQLSYLVIGAGDDGRLHIYRGPPTAGEKLLAAMRTRKRYLGKKEGSPTTTPYAVEFRYKKKASSDKKYQCEFFSDDEKKRPKGFDGLLELKPSKWPNAESIARPTANYTDARNAIIDGMTAAGFGDDVLSLLDAKDVEDFVDRFFPPSEIQDDEEGEEPWDEEDGDEGVVDDDDEGVVDEGDEADEDEPEPEPEPDPEPRRRSRSRSAKGKAAKGKAKDKKDRPTRSQRALGSDKQGKQNGKSRTRTRTRSTRSKGKAKDDKGKTGGGTRRSRRSSVPFDK